MLFQVWVCPLILTTSKLRVTHRSLEMSHIYNFKGKGELGGCSSCWRRLRIDHSKHKEKNLLFPFPPNVGGPLVSQSFL